MKRYALILALIAATSVACHSRGREDSSSNPKKPGPVEPQTGKCIDNWEGFERAYAREGLSGLRKCLTFRLRDKPSADLNSAYIQFDLEKALPTDAAKFAKWADRHGPLLRGLKGWPSAGPGEVYQLTPELDPATAQAILNPFLMPTKSDMRITQTPAPKVFFALDDLTDFLENPPQPSKIDASAFSFDPRAAALIEAYKRGPDRVQMRESLGKGCGESCVNASARLSIGAYQAEFRSYEILNAVFREEIVLFDAGNSIMGYASLARGKLLSIFLLERAMHGELQSFTAFSPAGKRVFRSSWNSGSESDLRDRARLRPATFTKSVAVCEDEISLSVLAKRGLHSSIRLGPDLNTSYYGWQDATSSPAQFWLGRTFLNALDLPFNQYGEDYTGHSESTILTLLKGGEVTDLGIVPLGADQCLRTRSWAGPLKADGLVRVLNFSASNTGEKEGCDVLMRGHPIHDPHFLWVIAAGNQGSPRPLACPQHLSGQKNLIIVGASENGRMHELSNYGEDFVDIAADGDDHDRGSWGTSFAAPKVSRLAAELFAAYPALTAEQIRLAILLGATDAGLPVRSRGELDEDTAADIAALIAEGNTPEEAVRQTFWWSQKTRKLEILKQLTKE